MKHKHGDEVDGWLIIDKPQGMGSTQVVGKTRYLLQAKKNGHTGTLDPFATGVLPIAFGEATKLVPFVTDGKKEYEFTLKWGEKTDTGDTEGEVIARCDKVPNHDEIIAALPHFIGKITQVPPVYSAIKINGQPAYKLARKGENVEIKPREVEIYALELLEEMPDSARFRVECSKGTYIRTLGKDIAEYLGTLGYLTALRRTKCGNFDLKSKILLDSLEKIEYVENRRQLLLPLETSLRDIAEIAVTAEDAKKLSMGQGISPKNYSVSAQENLAAAEFDDCLIALVQIGEKKISPIRVFNQFKKGNKDVDQ
ncbi:MAG: tRNA pseudouridine(55) synthase TruB [Alphaproteobacteria bacterium]|nr:tRNA pseudouridine(55) synthase TruB [Alphaproteobacteria bacterium]